MKKSIIVITLFLSVEVINATEEDTARKYELLGGQEKSVVGQYIDKYVKVNDKVKEKHVDEEFVLYGGASYLNVSYDLDSGLAENRKKDGIKVFFGEQVDDFLSGELHYLNYDYNNSATDAGAVKAQSLGYSILLKYTNRSRFQPFVRVGIHWWDADFINTGSKDNVDGLDAFFGAGLNYFIKKGWFARIEYEKMRLDYSKDRADLDIISFGVGRKF